MKALVNILFYLAMAFVLYLLLRLFVYSTFRIPSDSMYPVLLPGDEIVVEKLSTGARLFDIFEASKGAEVKIRRTPAWNSFERGDILVFNFPFHETWDSIAMDYGKYFIKRCVGQPGDTLTIENFRYVVNGIHFDYNHFKSSSGVESLRALHLDSIDKWTIKDFGPMIIPAKGDSLEINRTNYLRYKPLIEWETKKKIVLRDSVLFLDNKELDCYRFNENYYFVIGDNFMNSMDSRYWGLLPEPFIVGKASFIWWSQDGDHVRWERLLKGFGITTGRHKTIASNEKSSPPMVPAARGNQKDN